MYLVGGDDYIRGLELVSWRRSGIAWTVEDFTGDGRGLSIGDVGLTAGQWLCQWLC